MDFSKRVVIHTEDQEWQSSPMPGVWRKPLAREEKEQGHATSIVKYDAGSSFSEHDHPRGEEILVLEGTFSDQTGDYGKGQYFRNPKGFRHAPFSKEGCVIFVKLHQFQADDKTHLLIDSKNSQWQQGHGKLKVMPLHSHLTESTALVFWPAGATFQLHTHFGGEEIFVISGELIDEFGHYTGGTWLRNPHASQHNPYALVDTLIWVKTGHL